MRLAYARDVVSVPPTSLSVTVQPAGEFWLWSSRIEFESERHSSLAGSGVTADPAAAGMWARDVAAGLGVRAAGLSEVTGAGFDALARLTSHYDMTTNTTLASAGLHGASVAAQPTQTVQPTRQGSSSDAA